MKKKKRILSIIACMLVLAIGSSAYGVQEEEFSPHSTFSFGPQAHEAQPKTIDDFIPLFAEQLRRYSEVAPELWPDNAVVNQSAVVEDVDTNRLWLIAPDGTVKPLSEEEADSMGVIRRDRASDFSFFDGGTYITVSESELNDQSRWKKYIHLGTYDTLIWLTHESFHTLEQSKWAVVDAEDIINRDREEFLEDTLARAKRDLLQRQLLKAAGAPEDTQLILEALATYESWKTQFPEDYRNALYFDRIEGTAFYYELVSSLYSAYPDQVTNKSDLDRALAQLTGHEGASVYLRLGVASEGYTVGGIACILLDRLESDWKERIINDPKATPIEMLSQHFSGQTLPEPQQLTESDIDLVKERILGKYILLVDAKKRGLQMLDDMLQGLPKEQQGLIEDYRQEAQTDLENLEKLIQELQD